MCRGGGSGGHPPPDFEGREKRIEAERDNLLKFIYSEKATNFCEISPVDLSYVVTVKSTVEIS